MIYDHVLRTEVKGIEALAALLQDDPSHYEHAIETLLIAKRIVVTGMGKSGHIGRKVAASFTSTGMPAEFVHPADAAHGDLGALTASDAVLAFSWSGETTELSTIINYCKRYRVTLIAVTSEPNSTLGKQANIVLRLPRVEEACPLGVAPTTSCIVQLAMGDCLAMELLDSHGFTSDDFRALHPGGKLGVKLLRVSDIMHTNGPFILPETSVADAIMVITRKAFGCVGIVQNDKLIGVITDGDLRRHINRDGLMSLQAQEIMTNTPKVITRDTLAVAAMDIMQSAEITSLFVVEDDNLPVGIVHIHDLIRAGVA